MSWPPFCHTYKSLFHYNLRNVPNSLARNSYKLFAPIFNYNYNTRELHCLLSNKRIRVASLRTLFLFYIIILRRIILKCNSIFKLFYLKPVITSYRSMYFPILRLVISFISGYIIQNINRHEITEILLQVALNTKQTNKTKHHILFKRRNLLLTK